MTRPRHSNRASTARTVHWLMLLSLLFAWHLQAAEEMTRFVAQPGCKVSVKGGNDIHEFDIQGKEIQGEAEFTAGFPATATPGKTRARIEGFIPVRSLHYGPTVMDKSLYFHLKEEAHPRILFHFSDLSLNEPPEDQWSAFSLRRPRRTGGGGCRQPYFNAHRCAAK